MFNFEQHIREIRMKQHIYYHALLRVIFLILVVPISVLGQGRNPEVLIYGDGIDAYTAAIQSAKSRLHTIWVTESRDLRSSLNLPAGNIQSHNQLDGGIWAELLAKTMGSEHPNDSVVSRAKNPFNPQLVLNEMEKELDEYAHLHIYFQPGLRSVQKKRRNWQVRLNNGTRFSVRSIVDASPEGRIAQESGIQPDFGKADQEIRKTGVIVTDLGGKAQALGLTQLIPTEEENLFFTKHNPYLSPLLRDHIDDLPLLAHAGQAVGAAAAYVAFYKTTSDQIEVRQVQAELLQYGARIVPYQDILIQDPHFQAIQRIGALAIFEPTLGAEGRYLFSGEKRVTSSEIEPVLHTLFSRSQIWFKDRQLTTRSDTLSLGELLSLIKYIAHRGNELDEQVENLWSRRWGFEADFDPTMPITRRHFSVLMDEFVKPFDVRIDRQGRITR